MIISKTPLRVSIVGGGTDLPSFYLNSNRPGKVISFAINRFIYISVNKKFDDLIRVSYSKTEIVDNIDKLEHNIIRECLRFVGIKKSIEIVYNADLPLKDGGSGLGSSSALTVGVLNALYAYKGIYKSPEELAISAIHIEKDILGHPVGKQDHYPPAMGGLNMYSFFKNEKVLIEPLSISQVNFNKLNKSFFLIYTGINRISSKILKNQQKNTANKMNENEQLLDFVEETKKILFSNNINKLGEILNKSWIVKKTLSDGISSNEIDKLCKKILNSGASGVKISGAGGGGFALSFCPPSKQKNFIKKLGKVNYEKINIENFGTRIIHASS